MEDTFYSSHTARGKLAHYTKTLTGIKSCDVYLLQNRRTKTGSFTVCKWKSKVPKSPDKQGQKIISSAKFCSVWASGESQKQYYWLTKLTFGYCLILIVPSRWKDTTSISKWWFGTVNRIWNINFFFSYQLLFPWVEEFREDHPENFSFAYCPLSCLTSWFPVALEVQFS